MRCELVFNHWCRALRTLNGRFALVALAMATATACGGHQGAGAGSAMLPAYGPTSSGGAAAAPVANIDSNKSKISIVPAKLDLSGLGRTYARTVIVSEKGYTGKFTSVSRCKDVAAFSPAFGQGPSLKVRVTPRGVGSCSITFVGPHGTSARLHVSIITITEYKIPTPESSPEAIVIGSDGAAWFTETVGNKIGRISSNGTITEYAVPTENSAPSGITLGPDGAIWFTECNGNNIGRIATNGSISEYGVPTSKSGPEDITAGPDGALWFTEGIGKIGRITTSGAFTEYPVPASSNSNPYTITSGSDGALWFTEACAIGRITTGGTVTQYPLPNNYAAGSATPFLFGIAAVPGAVWFVGQVDYSCCNAPYALVRRITTDGNISDGYASGLPFGIVAGPSGELWLTEQCVTPRGYGCGALIGHIPADSDSASEYKVRVPNSSPLGITLGSGGELWFADAGSNAIGQIITTSAKKSE
jgi:virginiamycin B lyase